MELFLLNRIEIINYCFRSGEEKYNSSHGKPLNIKGKAMLLLASLLTIIRLYRSCTGMLTCCGLRYL